MVRERERETERERDRERERLLLSQLLCRAAQSCCIAGGKSSRQDPNWEQNTPSGTRNRPPNAPLGDPLGAPRGDPVPGPKRARSRNLNQSSKRDACAEDRASGDPLTARAQSYSPPQTPPPHPLRGWLTQQLQLAAQAPDASFRNFCSVVRALSVCIFAHIGQRVERSS